MQTNHRYRLFLLALILAAGASADALGAGQATQGRTGQANRQEAATASDQKPASELQEKTSMHEYQLALSRGGLLAADERAAIAKQMARLTGLSTDYVLQSNLRIEVGRFRKELLRDRGLTVGRLDSRYTGTDRDAAGESIEYDPGLEAWNGPFAAAVNEYFRDELKWETDDKYNIWGDVRPWRQDPQTKVGEMLRRAMTQNPFLNVLVLEGYYDGGTDYFSAQYTIAHLDPSGALNKRFQFAFYESGHMMYVRRSALAKAKQDVTRFIQASAPQMGVTNQ